MVIRKTMMTKEIMRVRQRWFAAAAGLSTLGLFATAGHAQNLILNGSFEDNSASGTVFNMTNAEFNATVADATAFGSAEEIDLMDASAGFGLAPVDGDFKLGIHLFTVGHGATDAFSFDLSSPIVAGTTYTIDFWAHAVTNVSPGRDPVEIGVSSSAASFGTLVFTSGSLSTGSWSHFMSDFVAPVSGDFLTVRPSGMTWAHIDNFSLEGDSCYPDCDGNGILDIFDFLCFQESFVTGQPYACDCDPDPVCNIFDFLCFQNAFVVGCP